MNKQPAQTYLDGLGRKLTSEALRNKLKLEQLKQRSSLAENFPHAHEFFKEKGLDLQKLREHSGRIIGAGALAGTLFLSSPSNAKTLPPPNEIIDELKEAGKLTSPELRQKTLLDGLRSTIPEKPRPLTRDEEKALEKLFGEIVGVEAKATLEGEKLNTSYGYIGAEQHLRRYPGDTLQNHGSLADQKEGMAPGLGAWGYFAPSSDKLTPQLVEIEKWYAVVQTLYLPDWHIRQPHLKNWYKYRKVLIVNTNNGNAVVAAIADSGPAAWTGKHFGGSPEVMDYLGGPRYKKGPVLLFFVDDPENRVPLGPVEYNKEGLLPQSMINIPSVSFKQM